MARPRKNPAEQAAPVNKAAAFFDDDEATASVPGVAEPLEPEEAVEEQALLEDETPFETQEEPVYEDTAQEEPVYEDTAQEEPVTEYELGGWKVLDPDARASDLPPRNGMPVRLTDNPEQPGVLAFWKKTRAFSNPAKHWVSQGKWCDFVTGSDIAFTPRFWQERF